MKLFNQSAHMDTQKQVAALRHMLRASGLQRYALLKESAWACMYTA